jgi:hypothetical protein
VIGFGGDRLPILGQGSGYVVCCSARPFEPQLLGNLEWLDAHVVPPGGFVAAVVKLAMVGAA